MRLEVANFVVGFLTAAMVAMCLMLFLLCEEIKRLREQLGKARKLGEIVTPLPSCKPNPATTDVSNFNPFQE